MSMRIAVLGATGVYGRHLMPRLMASGYRVRALVRRPEAAAIATACGSEVARADIFDEASLRIGLAGCDIAINLATSLPGPNPKGDYAKNDQLRREGTPIWVRACRDARVPRILQQSIAMVQHWRRGCLGRRDDFPPGWTRRNRGSCDRGRARDGSRHRAIWSRLDDPAWRPLLRPRHRVR